MSTGAQQYNTNLAGRPTLNTCNHAEQELAHIRAMITQLECRVQGSSTQQETPLTSPDYWRIRVRAVMLAAGLPPTLEQQALALLAHLDALCASRSCAQRGPHEPAVGPGPAAAQKRR